jgi:hypothetical protein
MGSQFLPLMKHAGTDFLESHVGWIITVPEFQGHTENNNLVAVMSVLERSRNHKA